MALSHHRGLANNPGQELLLFVFLIPAVTNSQNQKKLIAGSTILSTLTKAHLVLTLLHYDS
nr:hypothetical protein [Shigella boydii]